MGYREIAKAQLKVDEGYRLKPYRDSVGKLTVGVGHNLDDKGLSPATVDYILEEDIDEAVHDAFALFPTFEGLTEVRQAVIVNLAFNMGRDKLAQFKKFRKAVADEDYEQAAVELGNSLWASQVGARATRLSNLMRTG